MTTPTIKTDSRTTAGWCQRCEYSLAGLLAAGRCPECGLPYDPHSEWYRLRPRARLQRDVVLAFILAGIFLYGFTQDADPEAPWWLPAAFVGYAVLRLVLVRPKAPDELLIHRVGVTLFYGGRVQTYSWDQLRDARFNWITGTFRLRAAAGGARLRCGVQALGGTFAASGLARQINALRQTYTADSAAQDDGI